jgi:hypothetical protein
VSDELDRSILVIDNTRTVYIMDGTLSTVKSYARSIRLAQRLRGASSKIGIRIVFEMVPARAIVAWSHRDYADF